MGRLLDQSVGTPRLEAAGRAEPLEGHSDAAPGERIAFHEPNSPQLLAALAGALDRGAIPVLAHPRWPAGMAADALRRAGAGRVWDGEPLATLLFTSGSTAEPKVVAHSLEAHLAAARASAERVPFGPDHRWLLSLPLCHVGGLALLFRAVVGGGTLLFPGPEERLVDAVIRTAPSHLSVVATQLGDLLADPRAAAALNRCEAVLLGGGPSPGDLVRRALEGGVPLRRTYGMTEMGSQIATEVDGQMRPLRDVELLVDDQAELWVRGPSLLTGYLEDDRLVAPCVDGWFATGDLARIAPRGGLSILGRRDNQFISGGENVQPEAVEEVLARHGIEAILVAVPDARYGARPVAFTRDGQSHDRVAEQSLPVYARPIAWLPLPETGGLKPRRRELAELAREQLRLRP